VTTRETPEQPARKRVWILTRHYPPDVGALSFRLKHLAEVLAQEYEVTVLTAQPNRYEGAAPAPKLERYPHLTIRRISSVQFLQSRSKLGRLLTELMGALWMSVVALRHRTEMDIVFASTPPFFYGLPGLAMRRLGGRPLVLDLRDLWLDWAEETGILQNRVLLWFMRFLERSIIRSATHLTLATESFHKLLLQRHGIDPANATVVFNGLDEVLIPEHIEPTGPRREGDPLNILYAGNLGPSQSLLGILDGMLASLDKWPALTITIVGDGAQWQVLHDAKHPRLLVLPHASREELARMCREADAFLLHLAALEVYHHTVPSKLFEYAAYQRPILCGVVGEAQEICRRHADCFAFVSDSPDSFSRAVDRLCSDGAPDNPEEAGDAGASRADRDEILRASRAPIWRRVFASIP
jgi:glycosyltransferase involved in cell wall biosynthesis